MRFSLLDFNTAFQTPAPAGLFLCEELRQQLPISPNSILESDHLNESKVWGEGPLQTRMQLPFKH